MRRLPLKIFQTIKNPFMFRMQQDYNLIFYYNNTSIWASRIDNKGSYCITRFDHAILTNNSSGRRWDKCYLIIQLDHIVNFYNSKNTAIWATNSILFSHFKGTNLVSTNDHNKMQDLIP
ncbi:hypothetical protein IEQ34_007643 [Dendrobium chrysotoxum]|uniref:Uncharacterized protein n=1 Tax=Dendrobium chrysotoxum TaxID=161865 RepID=A0AAV7H1Z3_DENCH|nr:hypothetical protein IEQ34_007643 [Dendrobium chrysotoxum]